MGEGLAPLAFDPAALAGPLAGSARRVLLVGPPGSGKSTLAARLGAELAGRGIPCACLGADPGSPAFGVPGAVSLGEWAAGGWRLAALEALCTLDAGRFRLPLVAAVTVLARRAPPGLLLVDAAGLARGGAAAELLAGLAAAVDAELVLSLGREGAAARLTDPLRGLGVPVWRVLAPSAVVRPGDRARARARTALWERYLEGAEERRIALDAPAETDRHRPGSRPAEERRIAEGLALLGTPPPLDLPSAWTGRQVALLAGGATLALGEVLGLDPGAIRVRLPGPPLSAVDALLVRDARRGPDGTLGTAPPFAAEAPLYLPPGDVVPGVPVATAGGPRPVVRVGGVSAALVNGVFGDPLLHVRVRHERRSLLFDLGDAVRLPARLAHQVTDVFLSHAHADHVAGFLWLVRSRIGDFPPCRVYGPPGIAGHAEGFVRGLLWDRAGVRAPRFQVCELAGERLREWRVEAGDPGPHPLGERGAPGGVLLEEAAFRVRASTLDHAGTPVLAFAFEPALEIHVRKDRLEALGVPPGPWLGALKRHVAAGEEEVPVRLPDGSVRSAGALAEALVLVAPGETLVYATDLADTAGNRTRLTALARGAHTLFCEAAFLEADAAQAARTGHLTTRACAEIAAAAGVGRLVPFHFSRRYETEPGRPYAEVRAVFPRVAIPSGAEEAGRSLS